MSNQQKVAIQATQRPLETAELMAHQSRRCATWVAHKTLDRLDSVRPAGSVYSYSPKLNKRFLVELPVCEFVGSGKNGNDFLDRLEVR